MAQFGVVILLSLFITDAFAEAGAQVIFVPCILLWAQLYTIGLLNEDRSYAGLFELLRLIVIVPLGLLAVDTTILTMTPMLWIIVSVYLLGSAIWLRRA
jgi:hypothetical protein